jgi:hypothetical protein
LEYHLQDIRHFSETVEKHVEIYKKNKKMVKNPRCGIFGMINSIMYTVAKERNCLKTGQKTRENPRLVLSKTEPNIND